jgi:diguanylate cyclase (GGDEF)-like protein/PAS domain S-box-containing protein
MTGTHTTSKLPTVLVVDDDETLRMLARLTLQESGFAVEMASNGLEALTFLRERNPDIILLDVKMPGMDGIRVCSELRKLPGRERVPVLMITALDDLDAINHAYQAGATDFVTKPVNWMILGHRLMYMLRASETFSNLVKSETKNRALINAIPDAIFQIDREGILIDFKAPLDIGLLVRPEQAIGRQMRDVLPKDLATDLTVSIKKALDTRGHEIFEYRTSMGESDRYFEVRIAACGEGEVLTLMRDITERKHAEEHMRYMAYHDSLTRLPNMVLFRKHLADSITAAGHSGHMVAVLFVDLDRFKLINDTLGHNIGDLLLEAVANRIIKGMRRNDMVAHIRNDNVTNMVARIGGDEFTILLPDIKKPDDVARVSSRILEELSRPFLIASHELLITASIGIAFYPLDGEDIDILIRNADTAMYHAKLRGRNNFQFFAESMNDHIKERLAVETRIRTAFNDGEFVLHYQPRYNISSGRIAGVEALLRWHPEDILKIPVEQVISMAGEMGIIDQLGGWVLLTACRQAAHWKKAGLPSCISVNLSVYEFRNSDLSANIIRITGECGLDPCCITIEITESVMMQDLDATAAVLNSLKDIGVKVSVDDFGTGFSSLSHLKRFPIDSFKIAQVLIRDMTANCENSEIINAIIALAHSLKLKVVAEGVETEEQLRSLREQGCDEFQGFFYSKAIPASDITKLLVEQNNCSETGGHCG